MEDFETPITTRSFFNKSKSRFLSGLRELPTYRRRIFVFAFFVFLGASFLLLISINNNYLVEVPRSGGTLSEGIIGRPRFINPVIAKSDADRDMTQLIYSGLLRATPSGELRPDLAESYTVSPDGLTYTFILKENLVWQDGVSITSEDILFTIDKVRDIALAIKSPRRANWDGVEIETPNTRTVIFRIKQPYAPFLENATIGIIPKHIWKDVPDDEFDVSYHNIEPIGSGPYRIANIVRDNNKGLPKYYDLVTFKKSALGEPYITNLRIHFFGNDQELLQAYHDKTVNQIHTIEPAQAQEIERAGGEITRTPLPRVFSAFFNQNQRPIFADISVRKALDTAVDKDAIVEKVLDGYGQVEHGPLPFLLETAQGDATIKRIETSASSSEATTTRFAEAKAILESNGWRPNALGIYEKIDKTKKKVSVLEFSISMPDVPELRSAAEMMKSDWEKIGASVTIKVFDPSTFATEVLIPRKYDMLFYGQILGRVPDPYAYWHSSQRNAPGLNIALYMNKTADTLLENARKETDAEKRRQLLAQFTDEITSDTPAIFVYSPDFLYATSPNVHGIRVGLITTESERFLGIEKWYMESERVWKWFRDHNVR